MLPATGEIDEDEVERMEVEITGWLKESREHRGREKIIKRAGGEGNGRVDGPVCVCVYL